MTADWGALIINVYFIRSLQQLWTRVNISPNDRFHKLGEYRVAGLLRAKTISIVRPVFGLLNGYLVQGLEHVPYFRSP